MYWTEIKRSEHYEQHHKGTLPWSEVVKLIYLIKNKKKKGNKIQIENERFYILCEIKENILYVINVKEQGG
ncbi:MAG: hypothetical protein AABX39_06560 [Nanoarchaeota archaeon]